jgi:hypothetical protein
MMQSSLRARLLIRQAGTGGCKPLSVHPCPKVPALQRYFPNSLSCAGGAPMTHENHRESASAPAAQSQSLVDGRTLIPIRAQPPQLPITVAIPIHDLESDPDLLASVSIFGTMRVK